MLRFNPRFALLASALLCCCAVAVAVEEKDACSTQLEADCGKEMKEGLKACGQCAKAHETDLLAHKCTPAEVQRLCKGGPSPSPAPGPKPGPSPPGPKPKPSANLQKRLVPGTHCLDGTTAGYYYSTATTATGSTKWVVYLEGGGSCQDETSCKSRAKNVLGSSTKWPSTDDGKKSPFLQPDQASNPDFFDAHRVFVAYCSGDSHSGTQNNISSATWGLWFSGHSNFKAIIEDLRAQEGMDAATDVLLTGSSAGAVGTFTNIDPLVAQLGPSVRVKAAPMGGWAAPAETGDLNSTEKDPHRISPLPPSTFASFSKGEVGGWDNATAKEDYQFKTTVWKSIGHPACLAAHPDDPFVCDTLDTSYQFIKAPIFIVQNRFDTYQLGSVEGFDTSKSHDTGVAADYVRYFGRAMAVSIDTNIKEGDGLFLLSCFDHTFNLNFPGNTRNTINGTTYIAPIGDWFFQRNEMPRRYQDSCGEMPCGTGCSH